ncbi:MAG: endonuclease [Paludibacteraceae bacterium]|nr:endonuclease [Paludibacteraceae bacterium]
MKRGIFFLCLAQLAVSIMAQPQAAYYTASTLDGKNGQALELALQSIVYPHTKISYNGLWEAYETTDLAPMDSIPGSYAGENSKLVYDMYAWMRWFPKFYEDNDHSQTGGINREHCVPNSWFGGESGNPIAYTDLHHLFPSDGAANNAKQNYPLGDSIGGVTRSFPTSTGTYQGKTYVTPQNACSHVWNVPEGLRSRFGGATKVFEPADMYKGDFARAYFYVVCAYEKKLRWQTQENTMFAGDSATCTTIQPWALSLLLDWHRNDPVSEKE